MAYDADRLAECRDAFRRLASLRPKVGAVWALRGLCEFGLREYGVARQHLEKALALGFPKNDLIGPVALYHQALLLIQDSAFDLAIGPLTQLVHAQGESPELVAACGLVLLRRPLLPDSIPSPERALVVEAGGAYCAHLARKGELACRLFEALLRRYPEERHLHYGYGLALAQRGLPEAAAEFRREIELHPDHVLAHVELAFTLLTRGASKEARGPAEAAVKLAPGLFAAHLALGRALTATGEATRGVEELEAAARLAPDVPEVHFAQDAARANEVFRALDAARRRGTAAGPPPP
jgi:tetratricopeptide (TPR) repeat protein